MPGARVLIVEDDFLVRMTLAEALADEGYEVVEAESGEAALALFPSTPRFRLLMTDMRLAGGMDGKTLAQQARAFDPSLPVIYMTGRPDLVAGGDPGRDLVVGKPYLPSAICAAAKKLIGEA